MAESLTKSSKEFIITLRTDKDCVFFANEKPITQLLAGVQSEIQLSPGKYHFKFVDLDNEKSCRELDFTMPSTSASCEVMFSDEQVGRKNVTKEKGKNKTTRIWILSILFVSLLVIVTTLMLKSGNSGNNLHVSDSYPVTDSSFQSSLSTLDSMDFSISDNSTTQDEASNDPLKVDMGFPSEHGTVLYWAVGNLTKNFTISPNRSNKGSLFFWGEINLTTDDDYNRKYYNDCYDNKKWISSKFGGKHPPQCISGTDLDIVHKRVGGNWRLPTKKEFEDLIHNCTIKRATENGQKGYLFTSKINGNTLFFPRVNSWQGEDVGAYWSGTLVKADPVEAYYIFMNKSTAYIARLLRCDAVAIRAVCDGSGSCVPSRTIQIAE